MRNADSDESVDAAFEVLSGYAVNVPEELDGVNLRNEFVEYVAEQKARLGDVGRRSLADMIDDVGFERQVSNDRLSSMLPEFDIDEFAEDEEQTEEVMLMNDPAIPPMRTCRLDSQA